MGDAPAGRRIEIRMTARQLRETLTSLSTDGHEALGITDPVAGLERPALRARESS